MTNRLIESTSPYLLQHAENPVNWQPWDEKALQAAQLENKPIFLSIGYSACHWCHVMEEESFSNEDTARLMNKYFINIKVDREERPDLDAIYMNAVVSMTGQGGWPMSVFLTPDQKPFYGGTYFPPIPRYGMPSFNQLLISIARYWEQEQPEAQRIANSLTQNLSDSLSMKVNLQLDSSIDLQIFLEAARHFITSYDWKSGGWGSAPRFPAPMTIEFLLQQSIQGDGEALTLSIDLLNHMRQGGMYDLVNGGFHRYSTDQNWLVPHFEKMLYDNAQLARVYLHAYCVTGNFAFRRIAQETIDFILAELTHPSGGFFSSLDADSEGEEGKYYLFSFEELQAANSSLSTPVLDQFDMPSKGHESNRYLLRYKSMQAMQVMDSQPEFSRDFSNELKIIRADRLRPRTDDKILTSWNAFTLQTLAEAARYLDNPNYLQAARDNAKFLLDNLYSDGRLFRSWRAGAVSQPAFLEDYASLAVALFSLYQADPDPRWYQAAKELTHQIQRLFSAPDGGFYESPIGSKALISPIKTIQDNVTPSGNALAVQAYLLAARFDPLFPHLDNALQLYSSLQPAFARYPSAFTGWLSLSTYTLTPPSQFILAYTKSDQSINAFKDYLRRAYLPGSISLAIQTPASPTHAPLVTDKVAINENPTVYLCQNFTCKFPITNPDVLKDELKQSGVIIVPPEN
jgi:uncharacterized protein YyaL (SSP411 family)